MSGFSHLEQLTEGIGGTGRAAGCESAVGT